MRNSSLIGQRFHSLTVISFAGVKNGRKKWQCQCDCGNSKIVAGKELKRGDTKSCGCLRVENLSNQRFGMLVVQDSHETINGKTYWLCLCDCGNLKMCRADALKGKISVSCGCYNKTKAIKHGHHRSPTYKSWSSMKERCLKPSHVSYSRYGGRGVTVCDRWIDSFENFLKDMGERPPGLTLDRIDPNGNYEPSNCRWATYYEQSVNRRNSRFISFQGKTLTLSQWASELGMSQGCLSQRINKRKWSVEKALTTPKEARKPRKPTT